MLTVAGMARCSVAIFSGLCGVDEKNSWEIPYAKAA